MRSTFEVIGITRSEVSQFDLGSANLIDVASFATSALDSLKATVSTFDPAILGARPEETIYIYVLEIHENLSAPGSGSLPDASRYQVIAPTILIPQPSGSPIPKELTRTRTDIVFDQTYKVGIAVFQVEVTVRIVQLQAIVPEMKDLESSRAYSRNGLGLGLSVIVRDPADPAHPVDTSPSLPFPIGLPLPLLGLKFVWEENGGTLGNLEPGHGFNPEDYINYLGKMAEITDPTTNSAADLVRCTDAPGGQLRWYSLEQGVTILKKLLGIGTAIQPDDRPTAATGELALALPTEAEPKLVELRRAGRWLYYECPKASWSDDNFFVTLPNDDSGNQEPGYLIVWRDDLPSRPVQCFDEQMILEGLKKKLHDLIRELATKLWGLAPGNSETVVTMHVPLGQVISLVVQRLQDAANNGLAGLIGDQQPDLHIEFAFLANDQDPQKNLDRDAFKLPKGADASLLSSIGLNSQVGTFQSFFEPGHQQAQTLDFYYRPPVLSERAPDPESAFIVQLQVKIYGTIHFKDISFHGIRIDGALDIDLNDLEQVPLSIGPKLLIIPEPLRLPTLAIFFWDHLFEETPLVMLPADSGLFPPGYYYDASVKDDLNLLRLRIASKLNDIHNVLKVVQAIWDNESLDLIIDILATVKNAARMVIDSTGQIRNLSERIVEKRSIIGDLTFNDQISSVVLIGPPYAYSKMAIRCYQHSMNRPDRGLCLRLTLPGQSFIAAIPHFRRLKEQYYLRIPNPMNSDEILVIPVPLAYEGEPTTGDVDFNDVVTGIEFVDES